LGRARPAKDTQAGALVGLRYRPLDAHVALEAFDSDSSIVAEKATAPVDLGDGALYGADGASHVCALRCAIEKARRVGSIDGPRSCAVVQCDAGRLGGGEVNGSPE
jgi:hypothetical protein